MIKCFVLDTNVLMYEPGALFAFEDNEVVIPLVVLDELDKHKSGPSQASAHARMAIRSLDELRALGNLSEGVKTEAGGYIRVELNHRDEVPEDLDQTRADNRIISVALGIKKGREEGSNVVVITKDINLRVKCDALGVRAEDYNTDSVIRNIEALYCGSTEITVSSDDIDKIHGTGSTEVKNIFRPLYPNEYILLRSDTNPKHTALAKFNGMSLSKIKTLDNVWGISSRNKEQAFAFDALFDPDIKLVTITGKAGCGKAEPLDAIVYTPSGPKIMGDININDMVSTPDGGHAKVIGVYPQGTKEIYRVTFSDGSSVECCDEHLWHTKTTLDRDYGRGGSVKELRDIRKTLRYGEQQKRNHSIPITKPVYFEYQNLDVDPYLLGCLLGDGSLTQKTLSFTSQDDEIISTISHSINKLGSKLTPKKSSDIDYYITGVGVRNAIKELGLLGSNSESKFIPTVYLYSGLEQRLCLLRGLMDTDGTVSKNGHVSYTSVSRKLADGVVTLVQSLGGTAKIKSRVTHYTDSLGNKKAGKESFRVNICLPNQILPFTLSRKSARVKIRTKYFPRRYIESVEYVGKKEAQCIYIDSRDHLYLTDNFVVTHNTLLAAASGVSQLFDYHVYKRIVLTRPIMPLGRDLGYLPGDMDAKMAPWMAPLYDNLDLIFSEKGRFYLDSCLNDGNIEIEPITYIRGRSMPRSYIIVDEAQNLTRHEVKTIITRVGEGSKVVLTGDIEQIDTPYIDSFDNGLSYAIEKFKDEEIAAHITMFKGERSELATKAAEKL